jgi:hypothetical protein
MLFGLKPVEKHGKLLMVCKKVHYSQQHPTKQPGAHTDTIDIKTFEALLLKSTGDSRHHARSEG